MKIILSILFLASSLAQAAEPAPPLSPQLLEKGKAAFTANCVSCHGENGDGNGVAGKYMQPKPRNWAKDKFKKGNQITDIFKTITDGLDGTSMPAFNTLPADDRWGLAYFVASFRTKK